MAQRFSFSSSKSHIERSFKSNLTSTIIAYLETINAIDPTFFIDFAHGTTVGRQGRLFFSLEFPNTEKLMTNGNDNKDTSKNIKLIFPNDDETNQLLLIPDLDHLMHFYPAVLSLDIVTQTQEQAKSIFSPVSNAFMPKFAGVLSAEDYIKLERLIAGALCYKIWCVKNSMRKTSHTGSGERADSPITTLAEQENKTRLKIIASISTSAEDSETTLNIITNKYIVIVNEKFSSAITNLQVALSKPDLAIAEKFALDTISFFSNNINTLRDQSEYQCLDRESKKKIHDHIKTVLVHLRSHVETSQVNKTPLLTALAHITMPSAAFCDQTAINDGISARKPSPPPAGSKIFPHGSKIIAKGNSIESSTPSSFSTTEPSVPVRQISGSNIFTRNIINHAGSTMKGYKRQPSALSVSEEDVATSNGNQDKASPAASGSTLSRSAPSSSASLTPKPLAPKLSEQKLSEPKLSTQKPSEPKSPSPRSGRSPSIRF